MNDVAATVQGDDLRSTVAAFYDRSFPDVYRYLLRATAGDRRLTEDLAQETYLACVGAARRGERDAMTMPWIIGVARHKLVDHYRRQSREQRKLTLAWNRRDDEASVAPFDLTEARALHALAGLRPEHRLVLVLRYLDDMTVSDVAGAIGRSVGATESLLVRARQSLDHLVAEADRG